MIVIPQFRSATKTILRGVLILLHGGGWISGAPSQFSALAAKLAQAGLMVVSVEYRLIERGDCAGIKNQISDVIDALKWVRGHANEYGIDSARIALGGGSAGGYLALASMVDANCKEERTCRGLARPTELVLLNPMLKLSPGFEAGKQCEASAERIQLPTNLPTTLVLHGTQDQTSSYAEIRKYVQRVRRAGNQGVQLVSLEGRHHGFFNFRQGTNPDFELSARYISEFLIGRGYAGVKQ